MGVYLGKRASGSIELPHGVKLTVKHADSATFELAGIIAEGDSARMKDGQLAAAAYGLDDDAIKAADGRAPLSTMTIVALGRLTITAWEGVLAEDDTPLPVDEAAIAHLLRASAMGALTYGDLFALQMRARAVLKSAAKNVSTVSPGTNTGEAVNGVASAVSQEHAGTENP